TVALDKGQAVTCVVHAARLGSPLDARLEVRDPEGRRLAENDEAAGADPFMRFTAPSAGKYQVRIHDVKFGGGPAYVYRLTLTSGPYVDRTYPLGGRRGTPTKFEVSGQGLPQGPIEIALPAKGATDHAQQLEVAGKLTNEFLLDLDDLPEHLEDTRTQPVALP